MTDHRAAISPGSGTGLDPRVAALAQGAVFSGLGRITQMVSADGTSAYTYDAASQLIAAAHDYRAHESYSYDANGNRTMSGYDTGDNNQLLSDGTYDYTYDDEGNRLTRTQISSGHVTAYEWDHRNRLISVTDYDDSENILQLVAYHYDLFNRRLSRALDTTSPFDLADAAIEDFVYDDQWSAHSVSGLRPNPFHLDASYSNVILDAGGSGASPSALRSRHLFGAAVDQLLAQEDVTASLSSPDRILWPLPDHLQTTRDLIDNAGDLREHYEYDSFGQIVSGDTSLTRYLFTSRELDPATNLNYHRARWYDAATGRWISEDPMGFVAEDTNLQRYLISRPSQLTDASGLYGLKSGRGAPIPNPPTLPPTLQPGEVYITVYVDQPVPGSDQGMVYPWDYGHAFLQISTVDLTGGVRTETLGFWPTNAALAAQWRPHAGQLRVDADRVYDVAYSYVVQNKDVTYDDILAYMKEYPEKHQYDTDACNCSDFAIDVMKYTGMKLPVYFGTRTYSFRDNGTEKTVVARAPGALGEDLKKLPAASTQTTRTVTVIEGLQTPSTGASGGGMLFPVPYH